MTQVDIHQEITDQIIAALEAGAASSGKRWLAMGGMPLRSTGDEYRGINALVLTLRAMDQGYQSRTWMTFNQAREAGGCVRKGERSTMIVFYKRLERERENDAGETETVGVPMLRNYRVFNVDQIDGLPADRYAMPAAAPLADLQRDASAEAALRSSGARIAEDGGNLAFYRPATDSIHLPRFEAFRSTGAYLATLAHELVHWTGADHRLDRQFGRKFGDKDYAFEELVAEIGAAFVCGRLNLDAAHIDDHAAYIGSWLKKLRDDKRFIFKAAALAQSAADLVLANAGAADRSGTAATITAAPIAVPDAQPAFAF